MFSLVRALPSPASAEANASLFGWFIGTMARSESSWTCMSALWLIAFADRPRPLSGRGVQEASRFSCMLVLAVRGFLDYAGPICCWRTGAANRVAFSHQYGIGVPGSAIFEAR